MVLAPNKTRITVSREDDDDEDLEALRMAALQSLRAKDTPRLNPQSWPQTNQNIHQINQPYKFYKEQRQPPMRSLYQTSAPQRNGVSALHTQIFDTIYNRLETIPDL